MDDGELIGDKDGQNGDEEGINEKGDEAGVLRKVRFNASIDKFFDDLIPG